MQIQGLARLALPDHIHPCRDRVPLQFLGEGVERRAGQVGEEGDRAEAGRRRAHAQPPLHIDIAGLFLEQPAVEARLPH